VITSYSRGHKIVFVDSNWVYEDNGNIVSNERPCARCNQPPTKEGYDACLGHIDGLTSACCGHGTEDSYFVEK
jgi:hypothetical protein